MSGGAQLLGTLSVREKIGFDMQAAGVAPVPLSQTDGSGLITAYDAGTENQSCVLRGWGPQQFTPLIFTAVYTGAGADTGSVDLANRTTTMTGKMAAARTQNLTQRFEYAEELDQGQPAPDAVLGPDGVPNDPLRVETLYANNKTAVRASVPSGHQASSSSIVSTSGASEVTLPAPRVRTRSPGRALATSSPGTSASSGTNRTRSGLSGTASATRRPVTAGSGSSRAR